MAKIGFVDLQKAENELLNNENGQSGEHQNREQQIEVM